MEHHRTEVPPRSLKSVYLVLNFYMESNGIPKFEVLLQKNKIPLLHSLYCLWEDSSQIQKHLASSVQTYFLKFLYLAIKIMIKLCFTEKMELNII